MFIGVPFRSEGERHIKMISMNRRLFWMHLEVHEVVKSAVHVHHDHNVPHVQG
jgi:hypothetical protein